MREGPTQDDLDRIWRFIQAGNAVPRWRATEDGARHQLMRDDGAAWFRDLARDAVWRRQENAAVPTTN